MDVAILLYEGLTALDAVGPYEVLTLLPGARVRFVAKRAGTVRTDNGALALVADHGFADVGSADVVVVPGSSNSTRDAMGDAATLEWLRAVHATTRWTTSVCSGALVLGAAGLLKGLRATTHWVALEHLRAFGAEPVHERVVREGKIVTAAGVSAGIDMALYLAAEIAGAEAAQTIQLIIEYDPQPPFDAGSTEKASPAVVEAARREMARLIARGARAS
ncbi:MAG TPA: DJ-1/PfpI family protein [Pyrinomonadaceae bacterium]|jgi:transcriptional regulator GlxA family with amidase domain